LTDDRACGADDVVDPAPGQMLRKLRFLMIDYNLRKRHDDSMIQEARFLGISLYSQPPRWTDSNFADQF